MKKFSMFLCLSILIGLAACGQGEKVVDPSTGNESIESERNDELIEDEEGVEDEEEMDEENERNEQEGDKESTAHPVELFFVDKDIMSMYRVETTVEAEGSDVFKKTLEAWIEGPTHDDLVSLLPNDVEIQYVEEIDGVAHVSFSPEILDANVGSGGEAMILEQAALIMKQFGFNETFLLVDGEVLPTFFGHMSTDEPIQAGDPEEYEKI